MERITDRFDDGTVGVLDNMDGETLIEADNYDIQCAFDKLSEYEDAEEQGLLIKLPCKPYDTVYIIEQCKDIPAQLDGTMWDSDGGYGTATGYYCPYQDRCPYDTDDCSTEANKNAVFEDMVTSMIISEDGIMYLFENSNAMYANDFGKTVFLTREAAEEALKGGSL